MAPAAHNSLRAGEALPKGTPGTLQRASSAAMGPRRGPAGRCRPRTGTRAVGGADPRRHKRKRVCQRSHLGTRRTVPARWGRSRRHPPRCERGLQTRPLRALRRTGQAVELLGGRRGQDRLARLRRRAPRHRLGGSRAGEGRPQRPGPLHPRQAGRPRQVGRVVARHLPGPG